MRFSTILAQVLGISQSLDLKGVLPSTAVVGGQPTGTREKGEKKGTEYEDRTSYYLTMSNYRTHKYWRLVVIPPLLNLVAEIYAETSKSQ